MKRTAYSYIRFSTPEQAKGDSYRRQMSRTQEFCQKHDLIISGTRFEDLGVSGWTGKNMERGALGDFLEAVKAGKIPKGSILIVENFDRFSRLKPRVAYNKLAEIIELGVDVVTLEDGKFHTPQTLDDFATLITSLAIMQRANEESTRKSSLIGSAWANKRKLTAEGKQILTKHCPLWLRPKADGTGFEPIPERVKTVKRIFRLVKEGIGKREISRTFDLEKIAPWSTAKTWRENYILEIIKSRTTLGELQPAHKKQPIGEPIKGYYPAIVDEATWAAVQPQKAKSTAGPRTDVNNLFSGLLYDGYHPEFKVLFIVQDKQHHYNYLQSDYARVDPLYGQRRSAIKKGRPPGNQPLSGKMWRYQEFEKHFLQHFEEIDFHAVMPEKPSHTAAHLEQLEAGKAENDKALANLIKALEGGQNSALVMSQIQKREASGKRLEKAIEVEAQRLKHERHAVDSFEEEQERLSELMEASTREARMALRALFHRIIERIDIFNAGLLEVPDRLKTIVYPDRYGMRCYRISLVGSYRMWIWWDGCQVWEEPSQPMEERI
jgi:DNA invertase Pin-like site-specific DNA recombinase